MSEYSLDASERPEDKNKGRIGAGIFGVLVLVFFVFPFFSTIYPVPEAEGLMASFGNVEYAGGNDSDNPNPPTEEEPQPEETKTEPIVEEVEDVETVEDDNSDPIKTTTEPVKTKTEPVKNNNDNTNTNSEPKKTVNTNAVFGGGGDGDNTGPGDQGDPKGKKDIGGGNGTGDQGDGTGKIGNRKIKNKCDALKNWDGEQGVVWVYITVNKSGTVTEAEAKLKTKNGISTITNRNQWKIAETCAKEYQYDPAEHVASGSIPISFKKQ